MVDLEFHFFFSTVVNDSYSDKNEVKVSLSSETDSNADVFITLSTVVCTSGFASISLKSCFSFVCLFVCFCDPCGRIIAAFFKKYFFVARRNSRDVGRTVYAHSLLSSRSHLLSTEQGGTF